MMARTMPHLRSRGGSEQDRRRRARNRAVFVILLALVALIYVISIVRMGGA
jgi:hypothetical protein